MLDLELRRHAELDSFLDLERLVLERSLGAAGGEIDGDRWAAFGVHGKGEDDAVARVVGVREVIASAAETEGLLVALHGLIIGIKLVIFIHRLLLSNFETLSLIRKKILFIACGSHLAALIWLKDCCDREIERF